MEPIDGLLAAGLALIVGGVYEILGAGAAAIAAGVAVLAVWLLLHLGDVK